MPYVSSKTENIFYKKFLNGYFDIYDNGDIIGPAGYNIGSLRDDGYIGIATMHKGKRLFMLSHRLIWIAFNGPIPVGLHPNHKNEIKHDNRLSNLELLTNQENIQYSANLHPERFLRAENNPAAGLTNKQVRYYRRLYSKSLITPYEIADLCGVSTTSVYNMLKRKTYASVK